MKNDPIRADASRYRVLQGITPYQFKKIQDACTIDATDVLYLDTKKFDAIIDSLTTTPESN